MQRCMGCMKEMDSKEKVCPSCGYAVGTKQKNKSHLPAGTTLVGRYTLGRVLAANKYTVTYLAWDEKLGRAVTIKEFYPTDFATRAEGETEVTCYAEKKNKAFRQGIKKMLDEGAVISKFSSNESIVNVYDCFEANNTSYICMECVEGSSLESFLEERGGRLAPHEAVEFVLPLINALGVIHNSGIVHGEIKPDCIFVTADGKPKLFDFGSMLFDFLEQDDNSLYLNAAVGFTPKEKYFGSSVVDKRTDIYGICATLYYMITSQPPSDCLYRDTNPIKPFKDFGITEGGNIEQVIGIGLNPDADDRPESMDELAQWLTDETISQDSRSVIISDEELQQASPVRKKGRAKKILSRIFVAVAGVLFVGAVVAVMVLRPWAPVRTGNYSEKSHHVDSVLDIFAENKQTWLPENAEGVSFGFVDIDGDGICELVTSKMDAQQNSINRYFTVNLKEKTVEELPAPESEQENGFDWTERDKFRMLQHKETGEILFWCFNYVENEEGVGKINSTLSLRDNKLTADTVCFVLSEEPDSKDKEYYFYQKSDKPIQKIKYETYCKVFFKQYSDLSVSFSFVSADTLDGLSTHQCRGELLAAWNLFSCNAVSHELT